MFTADDNRPPKTVVGDKKAPATDDDIISEFAFDGEGSDTDSNSVIIEDDDIMSTKRIGTATSSKLEIPKTISLGELSDIENRLC